MLISAAYRCFAIEQLFRSSYAHYLAKKHSVGSLFSISPIFFGIFIASKSKCRLFGVSRWGGLVLLSLVLELRDGSQVRCWQTIAGSWLQL
jgi:hypothetical protein